MDQNSKERLVNETPKRLISMFPLISTLLGGGMLWYTWLKYNNMIDQSGVYWYHWIQLSVMFIVGIAFLIATMLLITGRPSGRAVFMGGLSAIPIILFANLVVLMIRLIQNIVQGNAKIFFEGLMAAPHKLLLIPIIVIALALLGSLNKTTN